MKQDLYCLSQRPLTVGFRVSGLRVGNIKNHDSTVHDPDENSKPVDPRARQFHDDFLSFVLPLFRTKSFPRTIRDCRAVSPCPGPCPCPFAGMTRKGEEGVESGEAPGNDGTPPHQPQVEGSTLPKLSSARTGRHRHCTSKILQVMNRAYASRICMYSTGTHNRLPSLISPFTTNNVTCHTPFAHYRRRRYC